MRIGWCLRDVATGGVREASGADEVFSIASVGKLLLLAEVAGRLDDSSLDPAEMLSRDGTRVGDSGLWQHLRTEALPLEDVAVLVASVSDNLATNVLLRRIGLDSVGRRAGVLGMTHTALHDQVRETRSADHPPRLASGTAAELSLLMTRLPQRALDWLAAGVDLSMVASAFGLDPLAHVDADRGIVLRNKTGINVGVRCDVGLVRGPVGSIAYAVLAAFDDETERDVALDQMCGIGRKLRHLLNG